MQSEMSSGLPTAAVVLNQVVHWRWPPPARSTNDYVTRCESGHVLARDRQSPPGLRYQVQTILPFVSLTQALHIRNNYYSSPTTGGGVNCIFEAPKYG